MRHESVFHLTRKQYAILEVIIRGNEDGSFCDLDELIERVPYETSKASMQFSIRALIKNGMIEKKERELRRGARRVIIAATLRG